MSRSRIFSTSRGAAFDFGLGTLPWARERLLVINSREFSLSVHGHCCCSLRLAGRWFCQFHNPYRPRHSLLEYSAGEALRQRCGKGCVLERSVRFIFELCYSLKGTFVDVVTQYYGISALTDIMTDLSADGGSTMAQHKRAAGLRSSSTHRMPPKPLTSGELALLIRQGACSLFATGGLFGLLTIDMPFDWHVASTTDTPAFSEASRAAFGYYFSVLNSTLVASFTAISIAWVNTVPHMMNNAIASSSPPQEALKGNLRWIGNLYHVATAMYLAIIVPKYLSFMTFGGFVSVAFDPSMLSDWWLVVTARCLIVVLLVTSCRWWLDLFHMMTDQLGRFR